VGRVFTEHCIGDKNNLYTNGDEYLLPSGDVYVGFYHLHNNEAMVGASHNINDTDELLTPINGVSINNIPSQVNAVNNSNGNTSGDVY